MKKYQKIVLLLLMIFAITLAAGCMQNSGKTSGVNNNGGGNISAGNGMNNDTNPGPGAGAGPSFSQGYYRNNFSENLTNEILSLPAGELTENEKSSILYITEEEKLARDTYLMYFDIWGRNVFQNIAGSEQSHMDAMEMLIDRYGLTDPVNERRGVFTNENIQNMYEKFVSSGSESVEKALNNSIYIEETDISDLEEAIAGTDKQDLRLVYRNLLNGSQRHLDSFKENLELLRLKSMMGPGPVILPPDEIENLTGPQNTTQT
jgi:hypothetical protein